MLIFNISQILVDLEVVKVANYKFMMKGTNCVYEKCDNYELNEMQFVVALSKVTSSHYHSREFEKVTTINHLN